MARFSVTDFLTFTSIIRSQPQVPEHVARLFVRWKNQTSHTKMEKRVASNFFPSHKYIFLVNFSLDQYEFLGVQEKIFTSSYRIDWEFFMMLSLFVKFL